MKILLIGKNGQIGWELQRTLSPLSEVIALGRNELDLINHQSIRSVIRTSKPDLIINAAAYNSVDKAESDSELALSVNGIAPGVMAEEAALLKAALIHYSTDYVFDGSKQIPYSEKDIPNPINIYGKTKLAGEEAIRQTGCYHLILRTSWLYGLRSKNFLLTIFQLAAERDELTIVNDQYGSPTWSRMVAEATAQIIAIDRKLKGIGATYHLTAAGQTTWYGFTEVICKHIKQRNNKVPKIKAIKTVDYPTPAIRPRYSVLDNSLINKDFNIRLPHWQHQFDLAVQTN